MSNSRRRRLRSAELDRERSEELRSGGSKAHAAAVYLGSKGGRKGGSKAHRIGGLARVRLSRVKGGSSKSAAKIAASRLNAQKAREARLAKSRALKAWEQTAPPDYKAEQINLFSVPNKTPEE